jgi:uncharacterized membrane protein YedE/YeeE
MADDWQSQHKAETYKSLITISVEVLKMLALVNGGAAIAVLTYLGNLVTKPSTPCVSPPHIRSAVLCYAFGLVSTLLAFIVSYATQLALYNEDMGKAKGRERHRIPLYFGVLLAVLAAVLFGVGSWLAANALAP